MGEFWINAGHRLAYLSQALSRAGIPRAGIRLAVEDELFSSSRSPPPGQGVAEWSCVAWVTSPVESRAQLPPSWGGSRNGPYTTRWITFL